MSATAWTLRQLHAPGDAEIEGLADVLVDCVEGGASVSFLHPLSRVRAAVLRSSSIRASGRSFRPPS